MSNGVLYRSSLEAGIFTNTAVSSRPAVQQKPQQKPQGNGAQHGNGAGTSCNACGRKGHVTTKCNFVKAKHPDINPDFKVAWADSDKGKAWAKKGKMQCPGIVTLKGDAFAFPNFNDKGTGLTLLYTLLELTNLDITGHTLSMGITLTTNPSFHRKVNVQIDTGSLRQDFVSPTIAQCLSESGAQIQKVQGLQVAELSGLHPSRMHISRYPS